MNDIADAIRVGFGPASAPAMGVGVTLPGMRVPSMEHFQNPELDQIRQQAKTDEQGTPPAFPAVPAHPASAPAPVPAAPVTITVTASANPIEEYKALQQQIAELQSRAAVLHQESRRIAIAQIEQLIADFQIGMTELSCWPSAGQAIPAPSRSRHRHPAKYYDPATGNSWSGNGRVPDWLKGKDRTLFLIRDKS